MNARLPRRTPAAALALALGLAGGCSRPTPPAPVTGRVMWQNRPAEGVYVVFHALPVLDERGPSRASARTAKDGTFSLTVREPGEYAVTVFWPTVGVTDGETVEGDDRLGGRHRDPQRPVAKVTVQAGENTLPPIVLKP